MRWLALALLLAACSKAAPPPVPAAVTAPQSFRDRTVPIGSALQFSEARFAGGWVTVAAFPDIATAGCSRITTQYKQQPDGLSFAVSCGENPDAVTGLAIQNGPGRLAVGFDSGRESEEQWILWVDEGYRTAVIGTPDGRFGRILNRDAAIPPDRLRAAREVLEFNGYDLGRLQRVAR